MGDAFVFDRYINGVLMAEGVTVERAQSVEDAMRVAAKLASRGPNGEAPVLVLTSPAPSLPEDVERVVERAERIFGDLEAHNFDDAVDAFKAQHTLIQSLSSQLAERDRLASALRAMLREHDILSGNFGDVMNPKHVRPDRWPNAASLARAALASLEERT